MRFIHTADWQIGMKRHYFDDDAQSRFSDARENAIRRMGQVARDMHAEFVVVAGDVFETNLLRPRTVRRALDAMAEIPVPVYLLPGNHDPLGPGSIYLSAEFLRAKPAQVHVLDSDRVITVREGVEIVGVPWMAKRLVEDRVAACLKDLPTTSGQFRVMVAHGATSGMGSREILGIIDLATVESAIEHGQLHYLALGDRHSTTSLGQTGRVWYAGAPEPTDYDEVDAGNILVVDLEPGEVRVIRVPLGIWHYVARVLDVEHGTAETTLHRFFEELPDKAHTIVKLNFRGTIGILDHMGIESAVQAQREVFGAIERPEHHDQLAILPESGEMKNIHLTGFARDAFEALVSGSALAEPQGQQHRDALALYYRLMGEV